eukprot:TRINITY_DN6483_c0_g1_i1.p1 TRINITY_DN6483_c0_g1~~TRINITY_DN6483_c0_g1_i1.p1  ORF type:complete len:161 (+),score=49.03 TRINITY_DN6483_c0_g1_i1:76-558(+)
MNASAAKKTIMIPQRSILEVKEISRKKELVRFAKWLVVGAIGAVIDFSTLNLLVSLAGFHPYMANPFSFALAVVSNFILSRYWTFPESQKLPLLTQALQFFMVSMVGLLINQFIFMLALDFVSGFLEPPWNFNVSKLGSIVVVTLWNFLANRLWTFRSIA